jgi:hypothetical protein
VDWRRQARKKVSFCRGAKGMGVSGAVSKNKPGLSRARVGVVFTPFALKKIV